MDLHHVPETHARGVRVVERHPLHLAEGCRRQRLGLEALPVDLPRAESVRTGTVEGRST